MQRHVENEYDRKMLMRFIENEKLPFTASIAHGGKRSLKQNRLQRLWMNEIAEQRGDLSAEDARAYCKLTIGVPILRAENEDFCKRYDEIVKPLAYEHKISLMQEPLDFPVTRLMTTRQHAAYLDGIQRHFAEQGIELTSPDVFGLNFNPPAPDNDAGTAEPIASPLGSANELPDTTTASADSPAPSGNSGAVATPDGSAPHSEEAASQAMVPDASTDSASEPTSSLDAGAPIENGPDTGAATPVVSEAIVQGGTPACANASHSGVTSPGGENPAPELSAEDRSWLKLGARMMMATEPAPEPEALTVLLAQVRGIIGLMPAGVSVEAKAHMEQIRQHCKAVCKGEADLDKQLVARTALCSIADITPEPIQTARRR